MCVKQRSNSDRDFIFHPTNKSWSYYTKFYHLFHITSIIFIGIHTFIVQMNIGKMFYLNIDALSDGWKWFRAPMFSHRIEQNQIKFALHTYSDWWSTLSHEPLGFVLDASFPLSLFGNSILFGFSSSIVLNDYVNPISMLKYACIVHVGFGLMDFTFPRRILNFIRLDLAKFGDELEFAKRIMSITLCVDKCCPNFGVRVWHVAYDLFVIMVYKRILVFLVYLKIHINGEYLMWNSPNESYRDHWSFRIILVVNIHV